MVALDVDEDVGYITESEGMDRRVGEAAEKGVSTQITHSLSSLTYLATYLRDGQTGGRRTTDSGQRTADDGQQPQEELDRSTTWRTWRE